LRSRLGEETLTVWAEDDILHVLWRGRAEQVRLVGGVQPALWPVPGCDDLWEASLRIRGLDRAVISVIVFAQRTGDLPTQAGATARTLWRGRQAPQMAPGPTPLGGTIENHLIDSAWLRTTREVTVYRPPVQQGPLPACILADGQAVAGFADVLEPAVLTGAAPAVLLVGVHSALDPGRAGIDGRAREYLPGHDRTRFRAHLGFVTEEVIPWATDSWTARPRSWLAAGYSNGAAWAIAAAQRRPDVFTAVAALSAGVVPTRITTVARAAGVRHYLANGTLEPGFRRATRDWANRLHRARLPYRHDEWIGGHDDQWWRHQLPTALRWLLTSPTP
jgi:enterochelin esterase-like enzyme